MANVFFDFFLIKHVENKNTFAMSPCRKQVSEIFFFITTVKFHVTEMSH